MLEDLVDELLYMQTFSYPPDGPVANVVVEYIVCDLPALAFVKCTKFPTGAYACPKCDCAGLREQGDGRAVFITNVTNTARTDESFRARKNGQHHREPSLFEKLPPSIIDMVASFTLDGFHVVHIGSAQRTFLAIVGHYSGIK